MRRSNSVGKSLSVGIVVLGLALAYAALRVSLTLSLVVLVAAVLSAVIVASAIKVAAPWDRVVVLRLGRFRALRGPGLFGIIPIVDQTPYWIDTRVIATGFKAEKTLTKDTVPVDVDAVLFWKVIDPEKAALAVADYTSAIGWASRRA